MGIGFAVPINTAKRLLPDLKEGEEIERAYLGVDMAPLTADIAEDLNLPVKRGALIQEVVRNGPADDAGLRGGRTQTADGLTVGGDVLVKVDGREIRDPDDVAAAIADDQPGESVEVEYYRGDDRKTARVKLAKRPANAAAGKRAPAGGRRRRAVPGPAVARSCDPMGS